MDQKGFTLTELMITIAIMAILVTLAYPSFINQLKRMEARAIQNKITTMLSLAKSESHITRQNLIFCLADGEDICDKNAQDRLLLFTDIDSNKTLDMGTDTLVRVIPLNLKYGQVHLRAGGRQHTKFFGDTGLPRGHMGHIKYCPHDAEQSRMYLVSFNMVGGIKIKPKKDHDTECP